MVLKVREPSFQASEMRCGYFRLKKNKNTIARKIEKPKEKEIERVNIFSRFTLILDYNFFNRIVVVLP